MSRFNEYNQPQNEEEWLQHWRETADERGERIIELEQQLAEAQRKIARQEEELRIVLAQRQDYKAHLAEARALLERILPSKMLYMPHIIVCHVCGVHASSVAQLEHNAICPIPDMLAFLQKIGG